jgi:transcriptional regulator with XRE-family HTH domain
MRYPDRVELLRDARDHAGLTQRELARRAGTSQAMVARIERGQQSPSIATLDRLVRACGLDLRVGIGSADAPAARPAATSGRLLVWRCGADAYAFPLEVVDRIVDYTAPRRLPGQPSGYGIATVDGSATSAMDAAHRLGVDGAAPAQIIVVRARGDRRAVIVDRADVVTEPLTVSPAPAGANAAAYVVGLAEVDGELVAVLDPDGFCAV